MLTLLLLENCPTTGWDYLGRVTAGVLFIALVAVMDWYGGKWWPNAHDPLRKDG